MKKTNYLRTILYLITISGFINCSPKLMYPDNGILASDGVEIKAIDGSFILKANEIFKAPFHSQRSLIVKEDEGIVNEIFPIINNKSTHQNFQYRRVKVKTPYHSKEMYGILILSEVKKECQNSITTSSYRITIPEKYVLSALNGSISCVYESYTCSRKQYTTWVLWLSDTNF